MQRAIVIKSDGTWSIEEYEYAKSGEFLHRYIDLFDVVRLGKFPVDMYVHDEGMWEYSTEQNYLAQMLSAIDRYPAVISPLLGPVVIMGKPDDEGWETDIPAEFLERWGDELCKVGVRMVCPDGKTDLTGRMFLKEETMPFSDENDEYVTVELVQMVKEAS